MTKGNLDVQQTTLRGLK